MTSAGTPASWRRSRQWLSLTLALVAAACDRPQAPPPTPTSEATTRPVAPMPVPTAPVDISCRDPRAYEGAAAVNAGSLRGLAWEPYRREEIGWDTYAPVVAKEIGTTCPPDSPAFAAALARWQASRGLPADGLFNGVAFNVVKGLWQERRPFVMATLNGQCPDAPDEAGLVPALVAESYGGKAIQLRPGAMAAFRRMRDALRQDILETAADPQLLTLFSGYRSPAADEARCALEQNCQGVTRARCSAHRTGLALDINLGAAPGFRPDNSADENRRYMSRTAAYRWLVANADRYGFVNYVFEPWHWEWTGEPPLPQTQPWPPAPVQGSPGQGTIAPTGALSPRSAAVAETGHDLEKPADRERGRGDARSGSDGLRPGASARTPGAGARPDAGGERRARNARTL